MKSWVWLVIGEHLTIMECIRMQGVNMHFYNFIVPKRLCRTKLEIEHSYIFTWPLDRKCSQSVMLLNSISMETRRIKNPRLDVF